MTEQEMKARMKRSRELIYWSREEYQSDQTLKKPQPPLVKAPMTENTMELPKNFGDLPMDKSFLRILHDRRSNRVFTGGSMDLLTLSFVGPAGDPGHPREQLCHSADRAQRRFQASL